MKTELGSKTAKLLKEIEETALNLVKLKEQLESFKDEFGKFKSSDSPPDE